MIMETENHTICFIGILATHDTYLKLYAQTIVKLLTRKFQ